MLAKVLSDLLDSYKRLKRFSSKYKLHHVLYWIVNVILIAILVGPEGKIIPGLKIAIPISLFHVLLAYSNLIWFIPNLLYKKRYFYYVTALALSTLLLCFPLAIFISNLFTDSAFVEGGVWSPIFFVVHFIFFMGTVIVTSFLHILSDWFRQNKANKELKDISNENELKFLKSQINPHFLFNSLNSLYALTLKKSEDAPEMVMHLADVLRYTLYETSVSKVPLQKEINYINDIIALEKIRNGNNAEIEFVTEGDIQSVMIEPLIFINFIENGFKHGINSLSEGAWLKILLKVDSERDELFFSIENAKPKKDSKEKNNKVGGIGLENSKKRLKLLYPNKHKLIIENTDTTYSVKLNIGLS